MRKIRGSAQDLACSFADPNKLQNDVGTERCISQIWQFGDLSDLFGPSNNSKVIADLFRISYSLSLLPQPCQTQNEVGKSHEVPFFEGAQDFDCKKLLKVARLFSVPL
jgi:hypothetical protein